MAYRADGYLDIINGPRAIDSCNGYPCKERLSAFYMIVAGGMSYWHFLTVYLNTIYFFHYLSLYAYGLSNIRRKNRCTSSSKPI